MTHVYRLSVVLAQADHSLLIIHPAFYWKFRWLYQAQIAVCKFLWQFFFYNGVVPLKNKYSSLFLLYGFCTNNTSLLKVLWGAFTPKEWVNVDHHAKKEVNLVTPSLSTEKPNRKITKIKKLPNVQWHTCSDPFTQYLYRKTRTYSVFCLILIIHFYSLVRAFTLP